jgi:hypothetical protein
MVDKPKMFTLEEARRALPLVRQIAADLQEAVNSLTKLPGGTSLLYGASPLDELPSALQDQARICKERVDALSEEMADIGVELKGFQPVLVDFRSRRDEDIVYLCWAEGEEDIHFWHDLASGYRGRQPL